MSTAEEQTAVDGRLRAAGERWRSAHPDAVPMSVAELVAMQPVTTPMRARTPWLRSQNRWIRFAPIVAAVLVVAGIASIALVGRAEHRISGAPQPPASPRISGAPHSSASARTSAPATTSLIGHRWVLTGWTIAGTTTETALGDLFQFTVNDRGQFAGFEGCNSISGAVTVTATTIKVGSSSSTAASCSPALYKVATQVDSVWGSGITATWRVRAGRLYLTRGSKTLNYQIAAPQVVSGTLIVAGGPAPGSPRPTEGTIEDHTGSTPDGPIIATAPTATDGRFQIGLEPGTYFFTARSPSVGGVGCTSVSPLTLPGPSASVEVVCSIR